MTLQAEDAISRFIPSCENEVSLFRSLLREQLSLPE